MDIIDYTEQIQVLIEIGKMTNSLLLILVLFRGWDYIKGLGRRLRGDKIDG